MVETTPDRDEIRLLSQITQTRVNISQGNGPTIWLTVGRLMIGARGHDEQLSRDVADRELRQIGVKIASSDGRNGFWISNTHPWLKASLVGTPWSKAWGPALCRLPGGASSEKQAIRFAAGHISKAAWIPIETIIGTGTDEEPQEGVVGDDIPF